MRIARLLARLPEARVELVAKTHAPVESETGLAIVPTATFDDVASCDVLFVPGGYGQIAAIDDAATLDIALAIAEHVCSRDVADAIRIQLEYAPLPQPAPSAELVERIRARLAGRYEERRAQLERLRS